MRTQRCQSTCVRCSPYDYDYDYDYDSKRGCDVNEGALNPNYYRLK